MMGRDSVEFTGALALGAVLGAVAAILWRRRSGSDGMSGTSIPVLRG